MRSAVANAVFVVMAFGLGTMPSSAQKTTDFDHAVAEFQKGNYASAAAMFARVETASPGITDALLYRAKSLVHMSDFSGAESALRRYFPSHRNSSDALYMLGFVLNRENRPADSLSAYTEAAAITKPTSDDLKMVGLDYALLEDYPDAIKWLEEAVTLDQKNQDAWYYLGRAYYTKARLGDAKRAFQRILDLDPANARAENNLGLILETEGKPDPAIQAYRDAIQWQERGSQGSEQPYINLGNLLAEQGRLQEALAPLEQAVALAPNNAYCHMTLGVYYRKVGQLQAARRELERATALEPNNPVDHYQLGRLYRDIHEFDRAKAEFARTAELESRAARSTSAH